MIKITFVTDSEREVVVRMPNEFDAKWNEPKTEWV